MSDSGSVLVTGASSQIGVFLLPRLDAADFQALAVSRQAPAEPVHVAGSISWFGPETVPGSADFLVSCGPLSLACRSVEDGASFRKVVAFSTSSLHNKMDSADDAERDLLSEIAEEEDRLKSLCNERGIGLVLIRPTLVYGCGLDRNLSLLLSFGERTGVIPVSRLADGLRQPVHADDLAGLAVSALTKETGPLLEGEACGGSTLSYREMTERVAACGRRRIRVLSLPQRLLIALLGLRKDLNPEMVRRQAVDMTFDDTPFRQKLGYNPRPFNPARADFSIPSVQQAFRLPL